ncbi:MAG TPA: hypothetical protein VIX90_11010 [Edaphobacter sp.]
MKIGVGDKRKLAVLGVVGVMAVGAGIYLYSQLSEPTPVPAAAPVVVSTPAPVVKSVAGSAAKNVGTTSAQLDPTLKMGPMLVTEALVYSGGGRNIFSASSVPVEIPKAIAPARPKAMLPPPPMVPQGPPPPPPIDLKFFGVSTTDNGHRQAFLLHGEDVFLASDGDIVQRRYKVLTVSANSVLVEDMTNNNRQTLPLIGH